MPSKLATVIPETIPATAAVTLPGLIIFDNTIAPTPKMHHAEAGNQPTNGEHQVRRREREHGVANDAQRHQKQQDMFE